jgi:hypothetical protein
MVFFKFTLLVLHSDIFSGKLNYVYCYIYMHILEVVSFTETSTPSVGDRSYFEQWIVVGR